MSHVDVVKRLVWDNLPFYPVGNDVAYMLKDCIYWPC